MYKFPLASVLSQREIVEETHQKELSLLKKALADEMVKYDDLRKTREDTSKELAKKQKESITVSESMLYYSYIEDLSEQLETQEKILVDVEREVDQKREELVASMKDRKILENLKAKGLEDYNNSMIKKERDFMNEMASVRFDPKSKK